MRPNGFTFCDHVSDLFLPPSQVATADVAYVDLCAKVGDPSLTAVELVTNLECRICKAIVILVNTCPRSASSNAGR